MSLVDISKRVPARRVSAVALTLASVIGASAFILNNAHEGNARTEGEDVRWQLPPPPAYLRAQVAAAEAAQMALPTPPAAPQDATELNVAALPPEMPPATAVNAVADTAPQSPAPQPKAAPIAAPAPPPVARTPVKAQKQAAPKTEKQAAKPKSDAQPKQAKAKPKDMKQPRYAKVQELPPAPAIDPQPVAPPPPATNRIPIISSVVDGVSAVGNSLSNLVR